MSSFSCGVEFRHFDAIFLSCSLLDDVLNVAEIQATFICDCCSDVFLLINNLDYLYFAERRNSYAFHRSESLYYPISLKSLFHFKSYDLLQCADVLYLIRAIDFFSVFGSS